MDMKTDGIICPLMDNKFQSRVNSKSNSNEYSMVLSDSISDNVTNIWNLNAEEVKMWIKRTNALLPRYPVTGLMQNSDKIGKDVLPKNGKRNEPFFHGGRVMPIEMIKKETALADKLLANLIVSLLSVSHGNSQVKEQINCEKSINMVNISPHDQNTPSPEVRNDIYNILDPKVVQSRNFVHVPGAILSRLTMGGLINALVGKVGGIVNPVNASPLNPELGVITISNEFDITLTQLKNVQAKQLDSIISAKVEMDMLNSIPSRIVDILCPEVNMSEIMAIRRRIYNTVVLGRGTNASASAIASEGTDNMPVAARAGLHDIDKFKMCKICQNKDQFTFVLDRRNGDLICSNCGTVATESLMHEGSQFRKFEGEVDRNHHGDIANPLYSNAHNMSTTLGGISFDAKAATPGFGFGTKRGLENVLRNTHAFTEMNISQFGKDEKKTRVGYKDRQKKDAFIKMAHVGDALSLHQAVLQRAKELFAGFRDDRELVQQLKGVVAACLCEAFDQLSTDGREILKFKADFDIDGNMKRVGGIQAYFNRRASRRSNLHSSSMASEGNIYLNIPYNVTTCTEERNDSKLKKEGNSLSASNSVVENKQASLWDLDDCRLWLLDASRVIAQQWSKLPTDDKILTVNINESEGRLVRHSLTICDLLETELNNVNKYGSNISRKKLFTPRVREMGQLEIKWQQSHKQGYDIGTRSEYNSNSKYFSNSGPGKKHRSEKTAGQILMMKTAKKMGEAINDNTAGEAFHRELRALLCRQELKKKEERRRKATIMRFKQMKRKPWLHARVKAQHQETK